MTIPVFMGGCAWQSTVFVPSKNTPFDQYRLQPMVFYDIVKINIDRDTGQERIGAKMKKSCYWVKGVAAVSILLVLLAVGCGFWIQKNEKLSGQSKVQEASCTYGVSADDCAM